MDNFFIVAKQVAIFYALIVTGVVCRRLRLLDEASVRGVVNILIILVTPAVVIDSFCRPFDSAMLRQLGLVAELHRYIRSHFCPVPEHRFLLLF